MGNTKKWQNWCFELPNRNEGLKGTISVRDVVRGELEGDRRSWWDFVRANRGDNDLPE